MLTYPCSDSDLLSRVIHHLQTCFPSRGEICSNESQNKNHQIPQDSEEDPIIREFENFQIFWLKNLKLIRDRLEATIEKNLLKIFWSEKF